MDKNILDLIIILLIFFVFPIIISLIFVLYAYNKGKKKFEEDMKKKNREWNEYEEIELE